ncbi:MAG: hypothetical protein AB1742_11640 [bacterium]
MSLNRCFRVFLILVPFIAAPAGAVVEYSKVSSNTGASSQTSKITFNPTDASRALATDTIQIRGVGFNENKNIDPDTIDLVCGATTIDCIHPLITIQDDDTANPGTGFFDNTTVEFDNAQVEAFFTTYGLIATWCTVIVPENGGTTWNYPNAFRLDRDPPDVTTPANFLFNPLVQLPGGSVCGDWQLGGSLAGSTVDPDGQCATSACNLTPEAFKFFFHVRESTEPSYPPAPTVSVWFENNNFCNINSISSQDRDDPAASAYCFVMRTEDSAGNYSDYALADEKCLVPDGKSPTVVSVDYFKDAVFTQTFSTDTVGLDILTTNPCFFDAACPTAPTATRTVYLEIVMSEPLYDGQGRWGYTLRADDAFDNDNDGFTDEERSGYDGNDFDFDTYIDEDVNMRDAPLCVVNPPPVTANNGVDDDCDGFVDEEPNGTNGIDEDTCHPENPATSTCSDPLNSDEDLSTQVCTSRKLWNDAQNACVRVPTIYLSGADLEALVPSASGRNPKDMLKWLCTSGLDPDPLCDALPAGRTVYRFAWDVTGPIPPVGLDEGSYSVQFSMADSSGNETTSYTPSAGGSFTIDNTGPTASVEYFSDPTYANQFIVKDHDNLPATPDMPIVDQGNLYIRVTLNEYAGATPTFSIYGPHDAVLDDGSPPYYGVPRAANRFSPQLYTTCGQSQSCDPCTGDSCSAYDPGASPCKIFKACYDVDPAVINDGYAAVTVAAKDRLENARWDLTDAQAAADMNEFGAEDMLSDDCDGNSYPTFLSSSSPATDCSDPEHEPGADLTAGQFFAIDTTAPVGPSLSLPILPCDGTIARSASTCSPSAQTTNSPLLSWTTLSNGADDDGNNGADEETLDGSDNDGDGDVDEDAFVLPTGPATGTLYWEVRRWHVQVADDPSFATSSIVAEAGSIMTTSYNPGIMSECPLSNPICYYWRAAPLDWAGNEGEFSPIGAYYSFGVDTITPQLSITYFSDASRTIELATNPMGLPVTGDTADLGEYVYVTITSDEPLGSTPSFKIRQFAAIVLGPVSADSKASDTVYFAQFEVDAKGAGQVFRDGVADMLFTAQDLYGNGFTDTMPAQGKQFVVDTSAPVVSPDDISVAPNPASRDNDADGVPDELVADAVTITVSSPEQLVNPKLLPDSKFKIRVVQNAVPSSPTTDDLLDNDCDGLIDEEIFGNGVDDDADGFENEDNGTAGPQPGSGCFVEMTLQGGAGVVYSGSYNVYPATSSYDGTAQIIIGDTDPNSYYYVTDFGFNPVYVSTTFNVDTVPPSAVTLVTPLNDSYTSSTTPQFSWRISSQAPDLSKFYVEIATDSTFVVLTATGTVLNDGISTTFYYSISSQNPLSDNQYFWRVFALDNANNKSDSSGTFTFYVDTNGPSPPLFNAVLENPTDKCSTELTGAVEQPGSTIYLYVNSQLVGTLVADAAANFETLIDYDKDGQYFEDPCGDDFDADQDGKLDENPKGIFLQDGQNVIEGQVRDKANNLGARGCDAATPFYDASQGKCIITRDAGPPSFWVSYFKTYNDTLPDKFADPLPQDPLSGVSIAAAGLAYLKITASEPLPNPPTFSINQQGTSDALNQTTAAVSASNTVFVGSYTVNAANGAAYLDGDAAVTLTGTDSQGNTATDTPPIAGDVFTIDTSTSTFRILYFSNAALTETLPLDQNLLPNAKAGDVYLKIISNEKLSSAPLISINQQGTTDVADAASTALDSQKTQFSYKYTVNTANGGAYADGEAYVTITSSDIAGNASIGATPVAGEKFIIDTSAPAPPTLEVANSTTIFTQIEAAGDAEPYSTVQIFARLNKTMTTDDGIDNDGDGLADEEPNGTDGTDNDNDLFSDEDVTANVCAAGKYWSASTSSCASAPVDPPLPDGAGNASTSGGYIINVSGIQVGQNLLYARAIDFAGNVGQFSSGTLVTNTAPENVTLTHDFSTGWNLVGVPLQPAITTPSTALGLNNFYMFRLQNGKYEYGSTIEPAAPGKCYWTNFTQDTTVTSTGITSTTSSVQLSQGWNMVGVPYNKSVNWDSGVKAKNSQGSFALGSAEADAIVVSTVYTFDPAAGTYSPVTITGAVQFNPWDCFMIKALQSAELVFPD